MFKVIQYSFDWSTMMFDIFATKSYPLSNNNGSKHSNELASLISPSLPIDKHGQCHSVSIQIHDDSGDEHSNMIEWVKRRKQTGTSWVTMKFTEICTSVEFVILLTIFVRWFRHAVVQERLVDCIELVLNSGSKLQTQVNVKSVTINTKSFDTRNRCSTSVQSFFFSQTDQSSLFSFSAIRYVLRTFIIWLLISFYLCYWPLSFLGKVSSWLFSFEKANCINEFKALDHQHR